MQTPTLAEARQAFLSRFNDRYAGLVEGNRTLPTRYHTLNVGIAGLALALYQIGSLLGSHQYVEAAKALIDRAVDEWPYLEVPDEVRDISASSNSLFHSVTGSLFIQTVIHFGSDNIGRAAKALADFEREARARTSFGSDLTLGSAGVLLACALLTEYLGDSEMNTTRILALGDAIYSELSEKLHEAPDLSKTPTGFTFAHGWSGTIYAVLRYAAIRRLQHSPSIERFADRLIDEAIPVGEGLRWRKSPTEDLPQWAWASWCNGSAGIVHFLALLYEITTDNKYLDAAKSAAFFVGQSTATSTVHLCCGLAGQSYALWRLAALDENAVWAQRAEELADLAAFQALADVTPLADIHGLYKGEAGLALLLHQINVGVMPAMPLISSLTGRDSK